LGAKSEKKQYRNCTKELPNDETNTIQHDWAGYVVVGQQGAVKTSRNWNTKEAVNLWNWLGTGSNSFGSK